MYLHIGSQQQIAIKTIVALIQAHPTRQCKANPWTAYAKPYIRVGNCPEEEVKSYVITEDCVYGSPIRLVTLIMRYEESFARKR